MKPLLYNDWRKIQNVFDEYKRTVFGAVNVLSRSLVETENQSKPAGERLNAEQLTKAWGTKKEALLQELLPESINIPDFTSEKEITPDFIAYHADRCDAVLSHLLTSFPQALLNGTSGNTHDTHNVAYNLLRSRMEIAGKPSDDFFRGICINLGDTKILDAAKAADILRGGYAEAVRNHQHSMHRSGQHPVTEMVGISESGHQR